MILSGAVLDISSSMHPVTCQIAENFTENPSETVQRSVGNFLPAVEKSPRHVLVVGNEPFDARLVLMTAFGSPDTACEAALLGACVLNRPFELDAMHRAVLGTWRGQS